MTEKTAAEYIWFKNYRISDFEFRKDNMGQHLGIVFTDMTSNTLSARMPVDHRTKQPFGILHGGASCVLSETLGSVAAWMCIDPERFRAVGVEINANHLRSVTEGSVIGHCHALHVGKRLHVWQTDIFDESNNRMICTSRLTVAIIEKS